MKKPFCLILCAALALSLLACGAPDPSPQKPATPAVPAQQLYSQAKAAALEMPNRTLSYQLSRSRTVDAQTFSEKVSGTASFSSIGSDSFDSIVEETLTYGSSTTAYKESYCDGNAYCTVNGFTFSTPMTPEGFIQRQLPATLLDECLYASITLRPTEEGSTLTFSSPSAPESWISELPITLISATGTAQLDAGGHLVLTTYSAQYAIGSVSYSLEVSVRISTPQTLDLSVLHPDHTSDCVQIAALDAPKFLLRCVGDLFTSGTFSSVSKESIVSQAVPMTQIRDGSYSLTGSGADLAAIIRNSTEYLDYRNQSVITKEERTFLSGLYTYIGNDGAPVPDPAVTAEQMRTQIEDAILAALFALNYISDAQIAEEGDTYHITFTGNAAYCADLSRTLQDFLSVDLDGTADSYEDTAAGGMLVVDKATLLPVSLGMNFSRVHSFGKVDYTLSYQLTHTLDLTNAAQ